MYEDASVERRRWIQYFWRMRMKTTIPTTEEFETLLDHVKAILFEMMMTGRINTATEVTTLRWAVEQHKDPYWLISISGLGLECPMALDTIAVYLGERDYDINNMEVLLEEEDASI